MSMLESALQSMKSKFGSLSDRFKQLTWRRQSLPGGREVKVERLPSSSVSSDRSLMPYEEPQYWPSTYAASQWPMTRWEDDLWSTPGLRSLARFDDDLWNMGRMMREMEADINALMNRAGDWMEAGAAPWTMMTPWVESHSEGKYRANIPLGQDFHPEDVRVTLKDGLLTVRAKKEQKDANSRFYQEVVRQLTLPKDVKDEEVKSIFTPEGYLSVEAPMPAGQIESKSSNDIPVQAA